MIIGRTISSESFDYDKREKSFYKDASELKGFPFCGRLYDDAADAGFVLVSHKTGRSQAYYLHEEYQTENGEYTHWEFRPARPIRPGAEGTKIVVFND